MEGQVTTESYAVLGDRELLRRFSKDADEEAFAEIVRRYERLVNAVCRRVVGSGTEVDDAFQATFLTLAKRPRQVRNIQSLSSWLYSVAWRISVRLVRARRRHPVQPLPEEQTGPESDPLQRIADDQDAVILDEELQTLPNKYRDVLVMTYFADQTSQQIADQLDVSKGTIDGRIRQGRNLLRVRLARRGVGIGALAAAAHLMASETVSASPTLVSSTIEVGTQTLSQSLPGTTDLSNLEPLVRPEITSMISVKAIISSIIGVVALAGLAGMAGGTNADGSSAGGPVSALDTTADGQGLAEELGATGAGESAEGEQLEVVLPPAASPKLVAGTFGSIPASTAFTSYPTSARPGEKWLYEMLDEGIPPIEFGKEESLETVLQVLADYYRKSEGGGEHVMQVWFDITALENAGHELSDLKLQRHIKLRNIKLEHALRLLMRAVSPDLTATIDNEVLTVTTFEEAMDPEHFFVRTYNVAPLLRVSIEATGGGMSGGGMSSGGGFGGGMAGGTSDGEDDGFGNTPSLPVDLVNLVMEMTSPPARWINNDGEGGSIAVVGDLLVVRHNAAAHREVVKLLNLLLRDKK